MTLSRKKKYLRLTKARLDGGGNPQTIQVDVERVDGVVIDSALQRTQVLMLDGSSIYVRQSPNAVLDACEALGCPAGIFTKLGAREAKNDCIA